MLVNQLILVAMATVTLVAASTMKACNFTGTPDLVAEAEWHPARDEMANWKKLGCAKNMWGGTFGWNYSKTLPTKTIHPVLANIRQRLGATRKPESLSRYAGETKALIL